MNALTTLRSTPAVRTLLAGLTLTLAVSTLQVVVATPPAQAAPAPATVNAKINFGIAASTVANYTQDTGQAYSDGAGRGWVREDSLDGTHVGVDVTKNTRDRSGGNCTGGSLLGRTFIHMQPPASSDVAKMTIVNSAWELAVPAGQYKVEVGYGDATLGGDPESHTLNVEGTTLVKNDIGSPAGTNGTQTCQASRQRKATGWVTVTDGKLTVDARGGTNTKLAWITVDSVPVAGLTAQVQGSSVALDWADVDGASGYKVWRTESLPAVGASTTSPAIPVTQVGTPSSSAFTDTTAVKGVLYTYSVTGAAATDAATGSVVQALVDDSAAQRPTLPLKVDFGTPATSPVAGYVLDYGQGYSNTRGFGWVHPGTDVPLSIVGNGRSRPTDATAPAPLSTMIHAQYQATGAGGSTGVHRQGAWQVAVADGRYDVTVTVGEAQPGTDMTRNVVNVEGLAKAVDYETVSPKGVALTGAERFKTVTVPSVKVSDGFLTLDTIGGTNTKLTDLTVTALADPKPDAPTALTATAGDGKVTLDWADGPEADLQGYRVYRATTATVPTTGTPLNSTLLDESGFVDTTVENGTTYRYVVVAVDDADQASDASTTVSASPDAASARQLSLPFKLNFTTAAGTVPSGFDKDFGQAFTNARGYGWVAPGTHTPLDLVGNGRARGRTSVDARQDGLMHVQADDVSGSFTGIKTEGAWEAAVPDGSYRVTVSAGDQPGASTASCPAPCYDSVHEVNVEGQKAIDSFKGTAAAEFKTGTVVVEVTDGRLTIDADGGTNTKINYLDVAAADVAAPAAPQDLDATPGDEQNVLTWDANTDGDLDGYRVYASTSEPVALTAANRVSPLAPQQGTTFTHEPLVNGTAYHYVVTAVDESGNESVASAVASATPADTDAPAAPSALTASAGDGFVQLGWTASTAADVEQYRVYRSTTTPVATQVVMPVTTVGKAVTSFTDDSVTNATQYHYVVVALDDAGNVSESSNTASATPEDVVAPAAPSFLTATGADTKVSLTWNAGQDDDIDHFVVYRGTSASVALTQANQLATPAAGGTGYVDEDVTNGTRYYYRVIAVDEADNESESSAEVSAVPVPDPDVTAPGIPVGISTANGDNQVTVSWSPVMASDLAGYRVYRSATTGVAGVLISGNQALQQVSYVDTTAINGTTYYYTVTSVDTTGNASESSEEKSAKPADTVAPAAPTGVTATPGVNKITVTWDAAPSGSDVARYRVYRSSSDVFPGQFEQFGSFGVNQSRTFVDANVEPGVTYYYIVSALDEVNNESGPSTVPHATPLPTPDTTAPEAPTQLQATVDDDDVTLTWTASTSADAVGYEVFRADTLGATPVKISSPGLTGTTYVDSNRPRGSTSSYTVRALDNASNESVPSNAANATVPSTGLDLSYVFQTDAAAVPSGWTKDIGSAFSLGTGRGWVTQSSLAGPTHTPVDLTANTRLRTRTTVTDLQNRMIHMQYGDVVPTPTTNGNLTSGAWEQVLDNGRYEVSVSVGDQPGGAKTGCNAPCYDSSHLVRAEGVTVVPAFQATAANEYKTGTATVDVTDGRLTIDAIGGNNTKLNWVKIKGAGPLAPDTTAPGTATGLLASPGDRTVSLSWAAPSDTDIAGYQVFRAVGTTVTAGPATRVNSNLATTPSFADSDLTNGTQYAYVVRAVDNADNVGESSAVVTVTPSAGAANVALKVDFGTATTTPAAGYLLDYGQAFGARSGANQGTGLSFGWVSPDTSTPVSLVGNGRNRNTETPSANEADARRASTLHMQYAGTTAGSVAVPGSWEVAVPNGLYSVKVDVGDAGTAIDSSHWINVENQNAIAAFVPTTGAKFATATRVVQVKDGRLTLSPIGGTNTKITYVDVTSVERAGRPYAETVLPANGTVDVVTNESPTASTDLPDGAVDQAKIVNAVRLVRVSDGVAVPGVGATSGGGDTVSFRPEEALLPSTLYRFDILETAADTKGKNFFPFSSVFTTKTDSTNPGTVNAAFDKSDSGATKGKAYTSLVFGPDGKLYAGTIFGQIYRWDVKADGTLTNELEINTVRTHASTAGWEGAPNRSVIGMAFDPSSTAESPVLWITDNYAYLGSDVPENTGAISRLSGPNLSTYQEVITNLPRSIKDHETNSLAWHNGKLYVTQGSMNAMGATDGTWKRAEHLLSASVLELDPAKLPGSLPVDVSTPDMVKSSGSNRATASTYSPYAANAPLTMYATGIRNAFDLVWHSNGNLYTGTNGSAAGGNTPAVPSTLPASCANRPDGGYTGPTAPALTNNRQDETDYVFNIKKGKYYGHPNPLRCEFILNAGNPTGFTGNPLFKVNAYPAGQQADPNYDLGNVYDAGMHASADGSVEYKNAGAFNGALKGKLISVRYSSNQELVTFDVRANGSLSTATTGITGFTGFAQPLDVTENPATGDLYVSELPNNFANTDIKLLKPRGGTSTGGSAEVSPRLVFTDVMGGGASAAQNVAVKNTGSAPLTVTGATITGADGALFARTGTLPTAIPAGGSGTVAITFNPTAAGPRGGLLTLTTDSVATPTVTTTLRGLGTLGEGGNLEPSLQWVLDTLQIGVNAGDTDPTNNTMSGSDVLLGDEIEVESFKRDPFDNIVKFEPLALFGPAGTEGNVVTVGVHDSQDPANRTVVGVGPNNQNQRLLPTFTGTGATDLPDNFGFDFTWHALKDNNVTRISWSEDARNTWSSDHHKVRVYPLKNADGSIEPYAYVIAPEDVPTGVDFQDAVLIVRNVQPVLTSGKGKITADHPELVYSGVKGTTSAEQTVSVTNTGTTPLEISGASLTGATPGEFTLTGGGPATLPVGGSTTYHVTFKPGASFVGIRAAAIRVLSDDADTPTLDIGLYGLSLNGLEGANEPPLADVVKTLGRDISVGWSGLTNDSPATGAQLEGDEVAAPLFTKVGTGPVTLKPVARFSPNEALPFGWYLPTGGTPERSEVATVANGQFQTLNPAIVAGGASGFDPGAASFGLYVDSKSFNRFSYTQDGLNTGVPHAARVYPARNRAGTPIPNTYLVTFEDASNGDYQDYVFELGNVRVAGTTGGSTPVAKIDFGPTTSTLASGYTRDGGAAYTAGGSGWVNQASGAPQSMAALTRDRGNVDVNAGTLILMQPTVSQSAAGAGAWRYTLPNGSYKVTVGVGDPDFADSVHRINVEGQTVVPSFTPDADTRSTTGTATVTVTDGVLDVDAAGGTNTKIQYLDIDKPLTAADSTAPVVTAEVSGLQQSAGVYKGQAVATIKASDPESGIGVTSISVDGAPFTTYTAPVTITATGNHTVRGRAQNGAGTFTTTALTSFRVIAAGAARGDISVSNLDGVPFKDRLVMSRIQTLDAVKPNVVHDMSTLRITNTGVDGLNVTGADLTGPFTLVDPPALPALVPVGGVLDLKVRFTASAIGTNGGLWNGVLTVKSDDADQPNLPVELAGFWQSQSEGGQEPNVVELAQLFGYGTQITSPGQPLSQNGLYKANGDEILSPYWVRANGAQPVAVRQLAAYHTQGNTATFFWHNKGSSATNGILTHVGVDGQTVLPRKNDAGNTVAQATFAPTGAFGLKIDPEWSDPTRNDSQIDRDNGCSPTAQCGHHLRVWPARDRSGALIPNTYLVAMDYAGINYDYNDNLYLVSNMKPEIAADPAAPALSPGAAGLQLEFDAAVGGTLADADGQGTGFRSTQPNERDVTVGSDSYRASLLDLVTTAGGSLRVSSAGTATEGTNGSNDNTLINGLRLPFDGTGAPFSVAARLAGPVAQYNAGSEQAGVMLGNDQDNYVKAVVISKTVGSTTGPAIEFYAEQNGTGATVGSPVLIAAPAGVTSTDLALLADPASRTVRAAYRTNAGTWAVLPTAFTVPASLAGKLFDVRSYGGLLVSNKGGDPFVATFESFGISAGNVTGTAPTTREALLRVDAGSATTFTDKAGNVWAADTGRFTPTTAPAEGTATDAIAGPEDDRLYATYRGNTGSVTPRTLSYSLPTKAATKVDLRLHFAERAAGNNAAGKRLFDIDVEGENVRQGFDIFAAAGGLNTATVLDIPNVTVKGASLELALRATADYPAISAIEVLCQGTCPVDGTAPDAPTGLTAVGAQGGNTLDWDDSSASDLVGYRVFRSASAGGTFTELTSTPLVASTYVDTTAPANTPAFYRVVAVDTSDNTSTPSDVVSATRPVPVQQPVRINTGGPAQTVNGTTWTGCASATTCNGWVSGGNAYSEADTVTGLPPLTNNTIFQSEWTGTATTGQRAFGFAVPVTNGAYTVRLHFAELNKTAAGTRTFDVKLENTTVLSSFDVWSQAGGIDKAIVRQFPATVTDGVMTIDFIRRIENAKISAIEILPGADTTAPGAPTSLAAAGSSTGISLSWPTVAGDDVAGYHVYRSTSATGTFTKLTDTAVTAASYNDTAAPGGRSFYQVRTVDTAGNVSAPVAADAVRPVPAPGQVTGVQATGSQSGIALTWTASTATGLTGYNVYRSTSATGTFTKVNTALVTTASYADAAAPEGATSYYQVTAVNATGESVRSATASAARPLTAPGQVTGVQATGSQSGVALSWTASDASALTGYRVYRSSSATGTFTQVTTNPVTGTSYADATAPAGATSYYQVTAVNAAGESARSATASAARPAAPTVPGQVTGVQAVGSQSGIALSWTASTTSGLTGYNVYRSASATGTFTKVNTALVTTASYADAAAPAGATSYYQVTAVNGAGESARSATASAARPVAARPTIRINTGGPAVTAGGIAWGACSATGAACSNRVTGGFAYGENDTITGVPAGMSNQIFQTEWTGGVTGNGPVAAGQRAFGFSVPVANGAYQVRLHFAELNKTGAGQRTFDVRLENATVLSNFDVWAQAGGIDRAISRAFTANVTDGAVTIDFIRRIQNAKVSAIEIIPIETPGQVTGVQAAGSQSGVALGWTASTAPGLSGYNVYRASSATGTFTKVNAALVTTVSYTDAAAPAGATSYYQVTAVNGAGESARSATVGAARPATARPTIRINAGGPAVTAGGIAWSACSATGAACSNRVSGGFAHGENDTITGVPAGMSNQIFQTEWTGGVSGPGPVAVGQRAFGFAVPVPNGAYQVRLHFAELNKTAAGQRRFDVRLENATVLSNFDVWAQAGGIDRAIVRPFNVNVTDGSMTIDFIRRIENAKVSAIEIIPIG